MFHLQNLRNYKLCVFLKGQTTRNTGNGYKIRGFARSMCEPEMYQQTHEQIKTIQIQMCTDLIEHRYSEKSCEKDGGRNPNGNQKQGTTFLGPQDFQIIPRAFLSDQRMYPRVFFYVSVL